MSSAAADPSLFVIFGGTGDLSRRKLLPALARLCDREPMRGRCRVVGVSTDTSVDDASYRDLALRSLVEAGLSKPAIDAFLGGVHFQPIGAGRADDYRALAARLATLREAHALPENHAFYLAVPPGAVPNVVESLGSVGLAKPSGWSRIVIEKPFGRDLASALQLAELLHRHFDESQIYRIDHYLGKETVQNLLVFRFANAIFEALWNRERVQSVEIRVSEQLGVGTRAKYYDASGALRDMIQNHLTQLLTLIAMEVPSTFDAGAIRYEKLKVLRSIAPISCADVVRGRYVAGEIDGGPAAGYLEEPGIDETSQTETFVALRLHVNTWRWKGVPFYLRTGKRLKKRLTKIVVRFHEPPVSLFGSAGVAMDRPDLLVLTLQPDEGFSLHFDVKAPGSPFSLQRVPLTFRYDELFESMPDAYETLLHDVLTGDQTLFVHADEVTESWRVYTPLLETPPPLLPYAAGSWGPEAADQMTVAEPELW